jgi:hypothetical protein
MAYEQVQKPSSSFVPVQKKVSEFAPSAPKVQAKDVTAGEQEQMPLGSTPATDANWLMKHRLFKGNQFLQRVVAPASESESLESEESFAQRETVQRQDEGLETGTPYSLPVQAKLTIGEPGDKYEQEADRVAADVVQRIHAPESMTGGEGALQRQEMGEDEGVRLKSEGGTLQRVEISQLNRQSESEKPTEASADLEGAIQGARGSGQPLDESVREPMEREFGADFSGVRVHTDAKSDELNQSIQAKAFTTGSDIFFRQGEYEPTSRGGQELLAHELTHVVQQKGGAMKGNEPISDLGKEADTPRKKENALQRQKKQDEEHKARPVTVLGIEGHVVQRAGHRPKQNTQVRYQGLIWTVQKSAPNNPQITLHRQPNHTVNLQWAQANYTIIRENTEQDHDLRQNNPGAVIPIDAYDPPGFLSQRESQVIGRYNQALTQALTMIKTVALKHVRQEDRAGLGALTLKDFAITKTSNTLIGPSRTQAAEWECTWVEGLPDHMRRRWKFVIDVDNPLPDKDQEPHVGWTVSAQAGTVEGINNVYGHVWLDHVPVSRQ